MYLDKVLCVMPRIDCLCRLALVFLGGMIILSRMAEYTVAIAVDDEAQKCQPDNDDIPYPQFYDIMET
jgi:hypothetical protein